MKRNPKRLVTSILFHTNHNVANLLAIKKFLGMPLSIAIPLSKSKPGILISLCPYYEIKSNYTTDEIIAGLEEYEVNITIINQ